MKELFFLFSVLGGSPLLLEASCSVKVGVLLPLSGPAAAYGQAAKIGVQKAIDEIQARKQNCHLDFVHQDTRSLGAAAALASNLLINQGVQVLFGPMTSQPIQAVLPVANHHQIPVLSPTGTANDLVEHPFFSRTCFPDDTQAKLAASFLFQEQNLREAIVLTNQDLTYSVGLSQAFKKSFRQQGGGILHQDFYSEADTDFKAILGRIRRLRRSQKNQNTPIGIFLPDQYIRAALLLRQAKELLAPGSYFFIGPDAWEVGPLFYQLSTSPAASDHFYITHFNPAQLKPHQADKANLGIFGSLAYDGISFLNSQIQALKGPFSPLILNQSLRNSKPYEGLTGRIQTQEGNPIKGGVIMRFGAKKAHFFKKIDHDHQLISQP